MAILAVLTSVAKKEGVCSESEKAFDGKKAFNIDVFQRANLDWIKLTVITD